MTDLKSTIILKRYKCSIHGIYETLDVRDKKGDRFLFCPKCAKEIDQKIDEENFAKYGCIHSKTQCTTDNGVPVIQCSSCLRILARWKPESKIWHEILSSDMLAKIKYAYDLEFSRKRQELRNEYKKYEVNND